MFQENCEFCRIARKELPAIIVFEDHDFLTFLDFKPFTEAHTLVIPKKHFETIYDIPPKELANLSIIIKKVAVTVKQALSSDGISLTQNNGRAAERHIFHIHFHVIPRFAGKKPLKFEETSEVSRERLETIARKIRGSNESSSDAQALH